MNVTINGKPKTLSPGIKLCELIKQNKLNQNAVVIEINRNIIQKNDYAAISLKEHDVVEIVCFVGGG